MEIVGGDPGTDVRLHDKLYAQKTVACGAAVARFNTICLAKRAIAEGIPGDFAECGVNAGAHPACMAYVSETYGKLERKVHLFDSFQGLPMAGPDDTEDEKRLLGVNEDREHGKAGNYLLAERWQVEQNMEKWHVAKSILVYHEGWFQDTLKDVAKTLGPLALLRVDVDLHDSTLPVFRHLYPLVSKGGYIISDDWGEAGATSARRATLQVLSELGYPEPDWTRLPEQISTVWWRKP